jgi:hypothetical protein
MRLCLGSLKNASALAPLDRAGEQTGHGLFFDNPEALVVKQAAEPTTGVQRPSRLSIGDAMDHTQPQQSTNPSFAMTFSDVQYYVHAKTGGGMHWVHLVYLEGEKWSATQESTLFALLDQMHGQAGLNSIHVLWHTTVLVCHRHTQSWVYDVVVSDDDEAYVCIDISNRAVHRIDAKQHGMRTMRTLGRLVQWTANAISERTDDTTIAPQDKQCNLLMCDPGLGEGSTAIDVIYSPGCSWHSVSLLTVLSALTHELLVLDLNVGLCLWKGGQHIVLKSWNRLTSDGDVVHIRDHHHSGDTDTHQAGITSVHTGATVHCIPRSASGLDYHYVPPPSPLVSKFSISAIVHRSEETASWDGMTLTIDTIEKQRQWLHQHTEAPHWVLQRITTKADWEADNGLDSSSVSDGRMYLVLYDEAGELVRHSERYLGENILRDAIEDAGWLGNERRVFIPIRVSDERLQISLMWHGASGKWTRAPDRLQHLLQGGGRGCFTELAITGGRPATSRRSGDIVVAGGLGVHGDVHCRSVVTLSDRTFKEDIRELDPQDCLHKVRQWKPSSFRWCETKQYDTGFIAQELKMTGSAPHCVHTDEVAGTVSVNYNSMVAYLSGAVKEVASTLDSLANTVNLLGQQMATMNKRQKLDTRSLSHQAEGVDAPIEGWHGSPA